MKMFGFTLVGVQVISVVCPKCGQSAHVIFRPSDKNVPIPLYGVKEAEKLMAAVTTLPKEDDMHFLCINCVASVKACQVRKTPCLISNEAPAKKILAATRVMGQRATHSPSSSRARGGRRSSSAADAAKP